jgi:SPP1 gp7 family putative phage head morphogenesis protein
MNKSVARANLLKSVRIVIEGMENIGIPPLKSRDRREPGHKEKEQFEDRLRSIIVRHFGRQRGMIKDKLTLWAFINNRKAQIPFEFEDIYYPDDEVISMLMLLLQDALRHGIHLFSKEIPIQLDWTLTNKRAYEWAKKYTYDLIKGIDDVTREMMKQAISQFVDTPGMTIRDTMDMLPFDEVRAQRVAVTEITRTYATANQLAGEDLQKEFPDVRVVKRWYTNNDDIVCDICRPLDGKEVEINEPFTNDIYQPPAHVNCRCWTQTTTALGERYE